MMGQKGQRRYVEYKKFEFWRCVNRLCKNNLSVIAVNDACNLTG